MTLPKRILLVTGLSGAGKSTALDTLEDLGWEVVDNLPLGLLGRLLAVDAAEDDGVRPLAIGIDSRTRGFDPERIVRRVARLRDHAEVETLFLTCGSAELVRRFSATRRRHPLAPDRPAADGVAQEQERMSPLLDTADHVIDTTDLSVNALQHGLRDRFSLGEASAPTLTVMSFGYSRGVPRDADLVFDMRFLRNPHWDRQLRPLTGLDPRIAAHVSADPAHDEALLRIEELLALLLPRYAQEGKSYVSVAIGCTGGKHRSVHVAEEIARRLRARSFSPTVVHRDIPLPRGDSAEGAVPAGETGIRVVE